MRKSAHYGARYRPVLQDDLAVIGRKHACRCENTFIVEVNPVAELLRDYASPV